MKNCTTLVTLSLILSVHFALQVAITTEKVEAQNLEETEKSIQQEGENRVVNSSCCSWMNKSQI